MKRVLGITALAVFAVLAVGCASSGATVAASPMETKLGKYKTVIVNTSSSVDKSATEMAQLESVLVAKLRQSGMFDKVTTDTDVKQGLRLNAKIVGLRKMSAGKRVMLGAFAGRGTMAVDVELVDARTGKKLGTFHSEGKTSGGTVFAGTTEQAIEKVAEEIAQYLKQNT